MNVRFENAAAGASPFTDAHFDVVLSTLISITYRVLKVEGRVLVIDLAQAQHKRSVLARFNRHRHIDPRDIASLLDEAGFRCVVFLSGCGGSQFC